MKFKGYKSGSGNYITIADQKIQYKQRKKELKQLRKEKEIRLQKEQEYILALIKQEKREQEEQIKAEQKFIEQAEQFIIYTSKNLSYKEYLISWDIMSKNICQIESDLKDNKVSVEQVSNIIKLANKYIDNLNNFIYIDYLLEA